MNAVCTDDEIGAVGLTITKTRGRARLILLQANTSRAQAKRVCWKRRQQYVVQVCAMDGDGRRAEELFKFALLGARQRAPVCGAKLAAFDLRARVDHRIR